MFDTQYKDLHGKVHGTQKAAERANDAYQRESEQLEKANLCKMDIFIVLALCLLSLGVFYGIPKAISRGQTLIAFQMVLAFVGGWGIWGVMVWKIPLKIRVPIYAVAFILGVVAIMMNNAK